MANELYIRAKSGLSNKLSTTAVANGTFLVTTDTKKLYVDIADGRHFLGDLVTDAGTEQEIRALSSANILPKAYLSSDTHKLLYYAGSSWVVIGGDNVATAVNATNDANGDPIATTYVKKTTYDSKVEALESAIGALQTNSFKLQIIDAIANAPVPGVSYIMYLVAHDQIPGNSNVYDEYIWIAEESDTVNGGHYENIGTTEADFDNYYTKTQIDTAIGNVETAYQAADTAIDTRLDEVEKDLGIQQDTSASPRTTIPQKIQTLQTAIGNYPTTGVGPIKDRLDAIETNTTDATQNGTLAKAVSDLQAASSDGLAGINAKIGTYDKTPDAGGAYAQGDTITERIASLETDTASINRFNKQIVDALPEAANADPYTIYFVPETSVETDGSNTYGEYMYVPAFNPQTGAAIPAHFERIDSTNLLRNYYNKTEVDSIKTTLQGADTTNSGNIDAINAKIGTYDKTAGAGGAYNTGDTITERIAAIETSIGGGSEGIGARVEALEEALGTVDDQDASTTSALERITALETDLTNQKDNTVNGSLAKQIKDVSDDLANQKDNTVNGSLAKQIKDISDELNNQKDENVSNSLASRVAALETNDGVQDTDIDTLQTNDAATRAIIGTYDKTAGSGGAYASGETLTERVAAIETNTTDATQSGTLAKRVTDLESSSSDGLAGINAKIGTYDKTAGAGGVYNTGDTITERLQALETDTTDTSREGTLAKKVADLTTTVGNINRFHITVLGDNDTLPQVGTLYTIYFVPIAQGQDDNNGKTKYVEYMWVETNASTHAGYYEEIGITEADLDEYYKSSEVDALLNTERARILALENAKTANDTDISNLQAADNAINAKIGTYDKTANNGVYGTGDTITERLATLETDDAATQAIIGTYDKTAGAGGAYASGETLTERVAAIETSIGGGAAGIGARVEALEEALGTVDDQDASTTSALERIEDLEKALGTVADENVTSALEEIQTLKEALGTVDDGDASTTSALERITALETDTTDTTNSSTLVSRVGASEEDIDDIEAIIGTYDKTAGAGGAYGTGDTITERIAALEDGVPTVDMTATSDNVDAPILLSDADHNEILYNSGVTVNASTGTVGATNFTASGNVTADALVLGGATITYDSNTDALVFNF